MDLNKLTTADKVVAVSAILLLIFSFFPWFGLDECGSACDGNGWDVGFLWAGIPVICGILMLVQIAIARFSPDTQLPELPWSRIHLGLGVLAALLVVLKLLIGEDVSGGFGFEGFDLDRKFGLFLAAIAAVGLAVGGFLKFQEGEDATAPGSAGPPQSF